MIKNIDDWTNRREILDFFENSECRHLFFIYKSGKLTITLEAPKSLGGKRGFYLLKKRRTKLSPDNIRKEVLFGDLTVNPLETLSTISNEIFSPIVEQVICSTDSVESKEVLNQSHNFLANMYVTVGETEGRTRRTHFHPGGIT